MASPAKGWGEKDAAREDGASFKKREIVAHFKGQVAFNFTKQVGSKFYWISKA